MTDGNLFPEISSEPPTEFKTDALSPDPNTLATSSNLDASQTGPGKTEPIQPPFPASEPAAGETASAVLPESDNPAPWDGSLPPNLPPEIPSTMPPAPKGKPSGNFWLWAAPALLLVLIMFVVGARAFMMRGIANVSLDVVRPKSGDNVFLNQPLTVVARIRSSNGWSKANFYVNNQLAQSIPGQDSNYDQELNFNWTPRAEGAMMLRVLVTNTKGDQTASEDIAVMVIMGESGATITPLPAASATTTLTPTKGPSPTPCVDLFEIISESGLVQGTKMDAARPFTKSWTLKNVGSCKWEKYKFVFVSGSLLGSTTPLPVPITEPGGTADLNLNLLSPSIAGNFIGKWRVQNAKGDLFGPEMVYGLMIPSPTPTVTPTKTDTPTPRPTSTPRPSLTPRFTFTATATRAPTSTSTAVPSVTPTPTPMPTVTDIPTFTVTHTPIDTPTAMPTSTFTPVPPSPKYIYSDDFSDNTSGWPEGSTDDSTYLYVDGAYAIVINTKNFLQPIVPNDYLGTGDARIEVDVWKVAGSEEGGFGIVCGFENPKNFFIMGISTDGSVGVYQIIDEKVFALFEKAGQFTPTDPYKLIANCQNGHFTLDVNGTILIDLTNPVLTSNGGVGIYGSSLKNGSFNFKIDNFKVEQADQIEAILFRNLSSTPILPVGIRLKNANPKNQRK
jgi:hypothetical protein